MEEMFLKILNMSITATYVMIAVLVLRLLLKRAPRWISYALWSLVLFRLVCPVSISSTFSVFGRIGKTASAGGGLEHIPENIGMMATPQADIGTTSINTVINNVLPAATPTASANPLQIIIFIGACIWLVGIALMLIYSVVSYLRLKHRVVEATLVSGNMFETDKISSPFVCGLINPKIYLPVGLSDNERDYVLRHEQTHISRRDYIIKPLAFLVLSMHWFNPFMWLAFILMSRDLEMSCDEKVVSGLDSEGKVGYSSALIQLAMKRPILAGSPLAFGESGAKWRIKNVLNYKKPAFWILIVAIVIVVTAGFSLLTDPISKASSQDYDLSNFFVNGYYLGADINEMDTSLLTPTEPLNIKDGYDFNFEEIRYSTDEQTGRIRKMFVNVYENGVISLLVARANGQDNVSLDSNETYQIEGIEAILGKGKTGWHDREQRLRYMEYQQDERQLSATVRFVYTDGTDNGITHRLVWVIAESSLPYPMPFSKLTLNDIRALSQKGDTLTFEDFSTYKGGDASSNLNYHIMVYSVEGGYRLIVRTDGSKIDSTALESIWESGGSGIDIRFSDVNEFIKAHPSSESKPNATPSMGSPNNQIPITNEGYMTFAKDIVEKYYKNKDLAENNDFSKEVSNDTLKLLNAKIELGQMQNDTLGYTYRDYQISVTPYLTEKWVESETEILLYLRVERTWFYDNELYIEKNINKTTNSEVLKITVSKNVGNDLKMTECYDLYESITLGPIDQLYQKAKASGLDIDTIIDDYKKDFKESLIQKKNQMNMNNWD